VDDLRAFTSVPVLVSIPRIVGEADVRHRRRRFQVAAVSALLGMAVIVGASYFVAHENERLVTLLGGRS